jgi:putative membrane protein
VSHFAVWPAVNASLNAASAVFLVAGYAMIRQKRVPLHRACMLGATAVSLVFLVSYLAYHAQAGSTRFQGQGWIRYVYFTILLTHTILAMITALGLVPVTLYRALRGDFERHRALARWTFPIWLYVSVTGVIIYFMLYHWFAAPVQ